MECDSTYASKDAEQAVIGLLVMHPEKAFKSVWNLNATKDWFYFAETKRIYQAISEQYKKIGILDLVMAKDAITIMHPDTYETDIAELDECLSDVPNIMHINNYLEILHDRSGKRFVKDRLYKAQYETQEKPLAELVSSLRNDLGEIDITLKKDSQSYSEITEEIIRDAEFAKEHGFIGLPCRWKGLAQLIVGHEEGKTFVIAGRPGMGKSIAGANIVSYLGLKGISSLLVSVEMRKKQVVERMIGDTASINTFKLRGGKCTPEELKKFNDIGRLYETLPIYISDGPKTIDQLRSCIYQEIDEHGVKLVVIDYIQLLSSSFRSAKSHREDVQNWSNVISNISKDTGAHIIILSQLNRSIEGEPELINLRDSGAIEQDADTVMFIYNDPNGEGEEWDDGSVPVIWKVAKNRNGPQGKVNMRFKKTLQKFLPPGMAKDVITERLIKKAEIRDRRKKQSPF